MSDFIAKYAFPFLILCLLVLALTGNLFSSDPLVILGQVAALAVTVSARITFARNAPRLAAFPGEGPMLDKGPYRFIRHPMYAGALLFLLISFVGHPSLFAGSIVLLLLVVIVARIAVEEELLKAHYREYPEYARRTKRLIPYIY